MWAFGVGLCDCGRELQAWNPWHLRVQLAVGGGEVRHVTCLPSSSRGQTVTVRLAWLPSHPKPGPSKFQEGRVDPSGSVQHIEGASSSLK